MPNGIPPLPHSAHGPAAGAAGAPRPAAPPRSRSPPCRAAPLAPPPGQELVPAERVRPLPADVARALLTELSGGEAAGSEGEGPGFSSLEHATLRFSSGPAEASQEQQQQQQQQAQGGASQGAARVPGLTLDEVAALGAIVRALAPPPAGAAEAAPVLAAAGAGGPVDTCGAHFLAAHALALASPAAAAAQRAAQEGQQQGEAGAAGRSGSRASLALGGLGSAGTSAASLGGASTSSVLFQRNVSMKNAAGTCMGVCVPLGPCCTSTLPAAVPALLCGAA